MMSEIKEKISELKNRCQLWGTEYQESSSKLSLQPYIEGKKLLAVGFDLRGVGCLEIESESFEGVFDYSQECHQPLILC